MISEKLIPVLRSAGDFSPEKLCEIADTLNLPVSHVAGVATFYSSFSGMNDGKVDLSFAQGGKEDVMFAPPDYLRIHEICRNIPDIIQVLKDSGLVGRGGAAFPIASKWEISKIASGAQKYIVCNGSEGEGDTFKDMKLMLRAPHSIIEGMLLCAAAIHAEKGYIYVRAEYPECYESMQKAVQEADLNGFSIEIVLGAGAYVCGEETALIRSIVGKRGEPALKPPYPGVHGLFHKPTVINNAESFAAAAAWFLTGKSTKLFTVSGCVEHPGVYELPYGTTVRQIAEMSGAAQIKGFRLGGGYTGRILSADALDMVLDQNAGLGTGSIYFFGSTVNTRSLCAQSVHFLSAQSCGACVPCRYGSAELAAMLAGNADIAQISKICRYLRGSARCGLGQAIPNTVVTAMEAFPEDFSAEGGSLQ